MIMIRKQSTAAVLAAALIALIAMSGAAAAAAASTEKETFDNGNASVMVKDPPERGFTNGEVEIDLSSSTLDASNVTVEGEGGAAFGDQAGGDAQTYEIFPQYSTVNNSGGDFQFSILTDGTLATNVTVVTEQTLAVETDPVNASTINNASSVNVTVDVSEIDESKYLTGKVSDNKSFVQLQHDTQPIIANALLNNESETVTFDIKQNTGEPLYNADSLPSGEKVIFAPESVDKIEADGQVLYEESLTGVGGDDGGGISVEILAGLAALVAGVGLWRYS